ncbi:hypothetical protein DICVIV_09933 [Dictyocaulus viviparus]|uniref:Uncharacterized protein n=1 Tax=Dictyocaulus viviparus TaxID=29172 RepID=A0A0D8XJN7_DICVI|nr:hypothetical protein DICVIV_09933 [Dictyocaulus viviparus]
MGSAIKKTLSVDYSDRQNNGNEIRSNYSKEYSEFQKQSPVKRNVNFTIQKNTYARLPRNNCELQEIFTISVTGRQRTQRIPNLFRRSDNGVKQHVYNVSS